MNLCIVCLDALRVDRVTPEIMPHLSALAASGTRYQGMRCKTGWTPTSVAAMMLGEDDAFRRGADAMVGVPSIGGRLRGTHASGAFLAQATLATEEAMWIFRDFSHSWCWSGGIAWGAYYMERIWPAFYSWRAEQDNHGRPWFAYVHLFEVHEPYLAPEQWGPWRPPPDARLQSGVFSHLMDVGTGQLDLPEPTKEYIRDRYTEYCRRVDDKLSRIWPLVQGEGDDTIIMVVSDHGDNQGENGVWGHGWPELYQSDAARRIFCAAWGPGIPSGVIDMEGESNARIPAIAIAHLRTGTANETDIEEYRRKLADLGYLGG